MISGIILHIEVGKAAVADLFEKTLHPVHDVLVVFRDDGDVVPDSFRRMLLEQDMPHAHHFYLGVPVGIACEHEHAGIVSRDQILNNDGAVISGGKDGIDDFFRRFLRFGSIDLFHALERMLPVTNGACRLDDDGIGKGKAVQLMERIFAFQDDGGRIIDAVSPAHVVKGILGDQLSGK